MPLISSIGFGGIAGFLVGFAIKKIMKILAIIAGVFFAALIYLQSQGIVNMNWDKLQAVSQNIISALTSAVTTTTTTAGGGGVSIPSISNTTASTILPTTWITTMANFGIPLTGSAAMGFTIGFMKG
jgi:uncharacterized membrane protein (Fun14 family)